VVIDAAHVRGFHAAAVTAGRDGGVVRIDEVAAADQTAGLMFHVRFWLLVMPAAAERAGKGMYMILGARSRLWRWGSSSILQGPT